MRMCIAVLLQSLRQPGIGRVWAGSLSNHEIVDELENTADGTTTIVLRTGDAVMAEMVCDSNEVKRSLESLQRTVTENGGWLAPRVEFVSREGELSVCLGAEPSASKTLIRIPETCIPRTKDFGVTVQTDELLIESQASGTTKLHGHVFELMLDIYNHNGKIAAHRSMSPWFALAGAPELLEKVVAGRATVVKYRNFLTQFESGDTEGLLVGSFFGSRTLNLKLKPTDTGEPSLMPFLDSMNHDYRSPGFRRVERGKTGSLEMSAVCSTPVQGSQECFVAYNLLDALDAYLSYSFVNTDVPFVRSVPLDIRLRNVGNLRVGSWPHPRYRGELPANAEELRFFMPTGAARKGGELAVSHLLIPGEKAPRALRRVLAMLLRDLRPGIGRTQLIDSVLAAEEHVLSENIRYYEDLRLAAEGVELGSVPSDALRALSDTQLRKLRSYESRVAELA